MRLHARNMTPDVFLDKHAHRTVVLRFAGLRITMTPTEAHALADQLHDAAERSEP
ncbi:hypothetical protein [Rhodococcus sp. As11]|uniref:hypothetical protein n=1 Tax=Rhodococcus sp. As11 TaxID=3029189 RepID=UPI003B783940